MSYSPKGQNCIILCVKQPVCCVRLHPNITDVKSRADSKSCSVKEGWLETSEGTEADFKSTFKHCNNIITFIFIIRISECPNISDHTWSEKSVSVHPYWQREKYCAVISFTPWFKYRVIIKQNDYIMLLDAILLRVPLFGLLPVT